MHEPLCELLREQLARNGKCRVRVGGFCMSPHIRNGATVAIESVDTALLRPGDICAYFVNTRLLVHRLVETAGTTLRFCADRPVVPLHEINAQAVLGKVIAIKNPSLIERIAIRMRYYGQRIAARFHQTAQESLDYANS